MSLIYLSCAWLVGISLGSKFNLPPAFILVGLLPLPLLYFHRHRKPVILTSLCLAALFGGTAYFQSSLPAVDGNHLRFYNDGGTVTIKGMVARDPEVGDKTTHLRLAVREIEAGEEWRDVSGDALLFVPGYPTYSYGDVLLATGKLETPPLLDDFDYQGYLARQGIYSTMTYPEIAVLEAGQGFKPLAWIYSVRGNLSHTLARVLPEPQASLAQGIILGIRGNIPPSVQADFIRTGTAHLLAISGLHLSIVAGIMLSLGIWLFGRRRYIYIWLALGAIWLYALITGMHPPVFRAAIMASLFLAAELLGRQRSAAVSLLLAAAVMVGINPRLLWEASFQMSFMAMAGLIFVFPPLQSLGREAVNATLGEGGAGVTVATFIVDSISVSLGAVIAVWPLVAYYFGTISPIAPLATFFALPALPGIIITGALAGGLGLIVLPVAQVVAWLTWLFASYMLLVVKIFAAVPFIEGGSIGAAPILIYYSLLVLAVWLNSQRRSLDRLLPRATDWLKSGLDRSSSLVSGRLMLWVFPPLLALAVLVLVAAAAMPDDNLHVSFLDVGQGDAILIQRGSQQVLVDGGPSPRAISPGLSKNMPFWDRTIDMVILTHPNADHLTGLVEVLQRYNVGQVLSPGLDFKSRLNDEWLRLLDEKDIEYTPARAGQIIDFGDITIEVLNPRIPPVTETESDVDNNGVVLHLGMGRVSFLLTADIMWETEYELVARRANLASTVLKVAHHGSTTSTSAGLLATVNPQVAVISVGKDNTFGHPGSEVMERLKEQVSPLNIYRTDEHGTIEFITDGKRLWVSLEK